MNPTQTPSPQPVDIALLRLLLAAATPGPWINDRVITCDSKVYWTVESPSSGSDISEVECIHEIDSILIATLRNAAPSILDELERLRADNEEGMRESIRLSTVIWMSEYHNESPEWMPLETIAGVISQIDNMFAGIRGQRDEAISERDALRMENGELRAKLIL